MPRLVVNPGAAGAWDIQLKPGSNLIGRGFANDFRLTEASVSSSHCEIVVENGRTTLRDLGSTNGTFVNGERVVEAVLQTGQTILLGGVAMAFYADAPTAIAAAARPPAIAAPAASPPPIPVSIPASQSGDTVRLRAPAARAATPSAAPRTVAAVRALAIPAVPPPRPGVVAAPIAAAPPIGPDIGLDTGSGPCKHHPKTPGRFFCPQCRQYFCEVCVTTKTVGGVTHKGCRHCGAECVPVRVSLQRPVEAGFFARLPGAFGYPLRGAGAVVLIVGIVILTGLKYGRYMMMIGGIRSMLCGLVLQIFAGGYLFAFLQNIIHSTAAEDRELPDLPGIGNVVEDILAPFLKTLVLGLVCFGPAIVLVIFVNPIAGLAAACFGGLYFPMAFLALAILDSTGAINPLVIVPSILKVPLHYLFVVVLLGGVIAFRGFGDLLITVIFPEGLDTKSMGQLFAYLGANAFWAFFSFYLLIVAVHILGLLYVAKRDQLGWLEH